MPHNPQSIEGYHSGDTLRVTVTVEDDAENVVDIRDTNIDYVVAESQSSSTTEIEKNNHGTGGVTITDGQNGEFRIDIDPSDTEDMMGQYYHECQLVDSNGDVTTLFSGSITVEPDLITTTETP